MEAGGHQHYKPGHLKHPAVQGNNLITIQEATVVKLTHSGEANSQ